MRTVTWRSLRQHPARVVLSVLAVVLGVGFTTGTLTLQTMFADAFGSMTATGGGADVFVRGVEDDDGTRGMLPAALADELGALDGVSRAEPLLVGPVVLLDAGSVPVGVRSGGSQRPGDQGTPAPSLAVVVRGTDPAVTVTDGRLPTGPSEIVLDEATARESRLAVGDDAHVILGGAGGDVRVVGVVDLVGYPTGATLVGIDEDTGMAALAGSGLVPSIAVTASGTVPVERLRDGVQAAARDSALTEGEAVEAVAARVVQDEAADELDESMGVYTQMFTLLAVCALVVGMFIITNTFSVTVRQQLPQTAVLRALGASRRQVLVSVLVQAAAIGVVGSVVGVVAGYGLVAAMRAALAGMDLALGETIPVQPTTIAVSLVLGVVVSVSAALVPARRAGGTPPIAAMGAVRSDAGPGRVRTVSGAVLGVVGVASVAVALATGNEAAFMLGVLATPPAVVLGAPALLRPVLRAASRPIVASTEVVGTLAQRNAIRNPRRSAATATALIVGMVLVGIVSVFASSMAASMRTALTDEIASDFVLQSAQGPVPDALVERLEGTPGADVDTLRYANLHVDGHLVAVGNLTDGAWDRSFLLPVRDGSLGGIPRGRIAVQETVATEHGWALGDEVTLTNPAVGASGVAEPRTAVIGAIFDSGALGSQVLVGPALYEGLVPAQERATGTVLATARGEAEALRGDLEERARPYPVVTVLDTEEYIASILSFVEQFQAILYAILGMSLVVALLGIVNLLALSVLERTREIGMLRAVGLDRRRVAATVLVESMLLTGFGGVVGLAVGVLVATPMPAAFKAMGLSVLEIPWGQLALMLVVTALAGALAAWWPAARAARLPVLRSIATD